MAPPSSRGALRLRALEAREELFLLLARGGEVARLHMAVAADLLRNRGDLDCEAVVVRREAREQPLDVALVLGDQRALGAPLRGVAERVECSATQATKGFKDPENREHPRPETNLARLARRGIAARQQRRREVEDELVVTLEHRADLALERAFGVQPRNLVLVLVS